MNTRSDEHRMGRIEFVGLVAMMFATIAFSIDAMLPAMPEIANELTPALAHRAPLILTAFLLGMGVGTFLTGPLSDAVGRRPVVIGGAAIYMISAAVAWWADSLEMMLVARVFQGLGAAGPRVVAVAIIRDLYVGREMAKIISIVMIIFTLVPAIAPAMGALIIAWVGWRGIFLAFILFSAISAIWAGLRLPETLAEENRRPFKAKLMIAAVIEILSLRSVRLSILAQSLAMAMLFSTLMLVQPIYSEIYDRAASFPFWFGGIAVVAGSASLLNAVLVVRYGMHRLVSIAFGLQIVLSAVILGFDLSMVAGPYGFAAFLLWQTFVFFQAGLTLGNLNAIAMEPVGHIAGMAASVVGSLSTVLAALIASPVGLMFDGTTRPLITSVLVMAVVALGIMRLMTRGIRVPEAAE